MVTDNTIKLQKKRLNRIISKIISLYNDKISKNLENENTSIDDLNKLSQSISKNVPDLIKLYDILHNSINVQTNNNENNFIIEKIQTDEKASDLLQQLLLRFSEIDE